MPATSEPQPDETWGLDQLKDYVHRHGLGVSCGVGGKARRTKGDILADIRAVSLRPSSPVTQPATEPLEPEPEPEPQQPKPIPDATWSLDQIKAFCRERGWDSAVRLNVGGPQSRTKADILADVCSLLNRTEPETASAKETGREQGKEAAVADSGEQRTPDDTWSMHDLRRFIDARGLAVSAAVGGCGRRTKADICTDIRRALELKDTESRSTQAEPQPVLGCACTGTSPNKYRAAARTVPTGGEPTEAWSLEQLRQYVRQRGLKVSCQVGGKRSRTKADILRDIQLAKQVTAAGATCTATTTTTAYYADAPSDPDTDEKSTDSDCGSTDSFSFV